MKPEAMRGLILVIAAALVGAFVLAVGFDDSTSVSAGSQPAPEPTATPEAVVPTPEPTVAPADDPATTDVLVANGTGTTGLAGSVSTQLAQNFGYRTAEPTNAEAPADGLSLVYYTAGSESAAVGVAQVLGVDAAQVQPLPATPPVTVDLAGIEVVVILAADLVPAG